MRALIVHPGDGRAVRPRGALAGARALAAAGWSVGVGSPRRDFVSASHATRGWQRVPPSWEGVDAFIDATRTAVAEHGYEVVFGTNDLDILALSAHRDELGATVPHPPHERLLGAIDKLELASAAQHAGLRTPRVFSGDVPDGEVVVKPRIAESTRYEAAVISDARRAAQRIADQRKRGPRPSSRSA